MSPKPIIPTPDEHASDARVDHRTDDPLNPARGIITGLLISLASILILIGVVWLVAPTPAWPREGRAPHPIAAPTALLRARAVCPNDASPVRCRSALRKAYAAVAWQRKARWHAEASTSKDVVLDAIHWASQKTGVPAWRMIGIGNCESHLFWLAESGQYKSWAQLSTRHRSDPLIARLTWRDPYAVALHVARYIRDHGESEWQCRSTGGLRW